eukprot:TRINITY_DN3290_c0_g2_i1.p1 TRINITY_DN3290_c0_g2~~TRINITY_DN3290_c0_g2_i1.p1  ORF type:complete len:476 (+),score=105.19 TRINITY_DN3290_c0_g2_i1:165-1592(+)
MSEEEQKPPSIPPRSIRNLRHHWYPISLSKDLLVGDDPVGLHILGDPIVLYRDPLSRKPVVLADICPHRSAPLSIGRVMNGRLECKYHGWQFDTSGAVVHIPALLPDKSIPPQAKTRSYPVAEDNLMVWVWPGPPEMADTALIPDTKEMGTKGMPDTPSIAQAMDLDVDFTLMVENLLDPAHLPFTHDGTISKRGKECPIIAETEVDKDTEVIATKFKLLDNQKKSPIFALFFPPCHVVLRNDINNSGWKMDLMMHCVPLRPGHMRLLFVQKRNFMNFLDIPLVRKINQKFVFKIVFQDYELLHGQTIRLKQGANPWQSPIQVDLPPRKFRSWITSALKESSMQVWFKGYSKDIEDLVTANSKNDCFASACDLYTALDEPHVTPKQRGVDNRCYTNPKEVVAIVNPKRKTFLQKYGVILLLLAVAVVFYLWRSKILTIEAFQLIPRELQVLFGSSGVVVLVFAMSMVFYNYLVYS